MNKENPLRIAAATQWRKLLQPVRCWWEQWPRWLSAPGKTVHIDMDSPDAADDIRHGTREKPFFTLTYSFRFLRDGDSLSIWSCDEPHIISPGGLMLDTVTINKNPYGPDNVVIGSPESALVVDVDELKIG